MDIDLHDVDLPTTKEKRKRVSTEISDRKKFNAFPEEDSDYNSKVLSAFSGYQFSGSQSSLPKKRDSTEIFDRKKFIAVLEEDSGHNSELWSAFTGPRSSLPKKGDLVVYFPQGHLEYEDPLLRGQPPKEEVRTYGLQPQIICRVEHVQLMIKGADDDEICAKITLHPEPEIKEADDEICANITLQPEPEVNSEEIEDCIWDEDGRLDPISTPNLFSKIFEWPDDIIESLTIPPKAAIEFFCWDKGSMDLQNGVTAKDFHGNEWKFPLIRDIKNGNWLLGWSEFARARNLVRGDRVVFLREKDTKLRFGIIRKDFGFPLGIANDDPLSEAAGAVLKKSIFSVMNVARSYHEDFVIPYHKYMKSITRPGFIGAKVHKQYRYPLTRELGVVTGMADLDPKNWPNSKWKCLLVTWVKSSYEVRVSPWEIVFDDSPSPSFDSSWTNEVILPRRQGSAVMYRKEMPQTNKGPWTSTSIYKESKLKKLQTGVPWTEEEHRLFLIGLQKLGKGDWRGIARNYVISRTPTQVASHAQKYFIRQSNATRRKRRSSLSDMVTDDMATDTLLSDEAIGSEKQKHVQEPGSIHCEADTTNHPFDIQKQTPAPQTSSQLTLCPDLCSLTSFSESKSTTNYEELKISNCSVDDLWRHLKENHSYEYLEFDSCSFPSSTRIPIPVTIKKLNITNCVDTEQVFTVLMDPNLSVESLEIDSCSSFSSMSTGGIPATLGQLKIVNCMNLNSLSESFETEKSPINERVHYSMADILELRKLEIQNCQKLESLPKGLHKLRNLDLLSINDCCSLEYFPEGGLPITCLTSLSISGCENLKCLPNKLHKVTSLQNLSISGCPSLMLFPEGGLPPNLVSLRIIDCENLISLSQWELHRLKHLRKYSFSCGCSDSEE